MEHERRSEIAEGAQLGRPGECSLIPIGFDPLPYSTAFFNLNEDNETRLQECYAGKRRCCAGYRLFC